MRKVIVTKYNEKWPDLYEEESLKLRGVFGNRLLDIHHVGSTSVPGLLAKPIIDIVVVVTDINEVDQLNSEMIGLEYQPMGENGIPQRRYFYKGRDERTHHVHIFQHGSLEVDRHLAFRDYLRTQPEAVKRYGDVKEALAKKFPTDIEAYIEGKDALVKEIECLAIQWRQENKDGGR